MKGKVVVIILCLLMVFSLTACYDEEKEISKAEDAYASGDITESLEMYKVIYDKGQNKDVNNKIKEIEQEIKCANAVNDLATFLDELMDNELREDKTPSKTDIKYFLDDINDYTNDIFEKDPKNNSEISKYISQFKDSSAYTMFDIHYDTSKELYRTASADDILARLDSEIEAIVSITNNSSIGYIEDLNNYFKSNPISENYDFE